VTVTNPYYEFDPAFIPGTTARAEEVNVQYQAIQNAFDLLPGAADAITTGTATFAPESGTGNAYVVTMPDTRTSNQDGDHIVFFATHTNTGAATLDVDGIGAVALVNWDGDAFVGSEIVSGRLYSVRYDATNTRFVIEATTDNALQVMWAEEWAIRAEDDPIPVAAGGDGVSDFSAFHWAQKSLASAASGIINTDIVTATPPTTEAVTGALQIWDFDDTDQLANFGYEASNDLVIRNYMRGGAIQGFQTASGGGVVQVMELDQVSGSYIRGANATRIGTGLFGGSIVGSSAGANIAALQVFDSDGSTEVWRMGHIGTGNIDIINLVHGGLVTLAAENAVGTQQTLFNGDPDGAASLYYAGTEVFQTDTDGVRVTGAIYLDEQAAAGADTAGRGQLYVRNESPNVLVFRDDAGGESVLGSGGKVLTDITTLTPPTTEAVTGAFEIYDSDETDLLANFGFEGSNELIIRNKFDDVTGLIFMRFDVTAGADAGIDFLAGQMVLRSDSTANPESGNAADAFMSFESRTGDEYGRMGFDSAPDSMVVQNTTEGTPTILTVERTGAPGVPEDLLIVNPHGNVARGGLGGWSEIGGVVLGYSEQFLTGFAALRTTTVGSGVVQVNTDGAGVWERVLTSSDLGTVVAPIDLADNEELRFGTGQDVVIDFNGTSLFINAGVTSEITIAGFDENDDGIVLQDGARVTFEDQAFANDAYLRNEGTGGGSGTLSLRFDSTGSFISYGGLATNNGTTQGTLTALNSPARLNSSIDFRVVGAIYLNERASAETDVAGDGQIWVRNGTPNELWFSDDAGSDFPVATAVARRLATNAAYNLNTAGNEGYNGVCFYDDGSAYTITLENSTGTTSMPVNASFQIIAPGSGTITVNEGTSTTLYLEDGTDTAGGCTMTQGAATVFRISATEYVIIGSGITA
jgi:hypothetical protein